MIGRPKREDRKINKGDRPPRILTAAAGLLQVSSVTPEIKSNFELTRIVKTPAQLRILVKKNTSEHDRPPRMWYVYIFCLIEQE